VLRRVRRQGEDCLLPQAICACFLGSLVYRLRGTTSGKFVQLPPVIKKTLPERSGMSLMGLKVMMEAIQWVPIKMQKPK
jgi:hypothetical protein